MSRSHMPVRRAVLVAMPFMLTVACVIAPTARIPTEDSAVCHHATLDPCGAVASAVVDSMVALHVDVTHHGVSVPEERVILGYGTVIDDNGSVLTPEHVVRGAKRIRAYPVRMRDGDIIESDDPVDMVVLRVSLTYDAVLLTPAKGRLTLPALPTTKSRPEWDDGAYVLCGTQGWRAGHITNPLAMVTSSATLIEVSVTTVGGDSGSPLVNGCGQLIGFVILGSPNNPYSYYVPAAEAFKSLENAPSP